MDKLFSNKITFFSFFYSLLIICYHANANVNFENIVKNDSYADKAALVIDTFFTESIENNDDDFYNSVRLSFIL